MSSLSPFLRLSNDESALCLHGLSAPEILRFARCSRRTMQLADSDFAWKHARPLRVGIKALMSIESAQGTPIFQGSRLLRHAPIALVCTGALFTTPGNRMADHHFQTLLARLPPRLHEIDASEWFGLDPIDPSVAAERWVTLLAQPACQSLRVLTLHHSLLDLAAVFRLPKLHSFRSARALPAAMWSTVGQAVSLTSLALVDKQFGLVSPLAHIASCDSLKLRHLEVSQPSLYGPLWSPFFESPLIQALQSLRLETYNSDGERRPPVQEPVTDEDFARAFTSMREMKTLYLKQVAAIDRLLPHLALAPALQTLVLEPRCGLGAETHPSASAMQSLLAARPDLHCTLLLPFPSDTPSRKMQEAVDRLQSLYRVSARKSLVCEQCTAAVRRPFGDHYRVFYFHLSAIDQPQQNECAALLVSD